MIVVPKFRGFLTELFVDPLLSAERHHVDCESKKGSSKKPLFVRFLTPLS
jgi:hypothetical protein